jgi:hypothetical protein
LHDSIFGFGVPGFGLLKDGDVGVGVFQRARKASPLRLITECAGIIDHPVSQIHDLLPWNLALQIHTAQAA